jgi:iduronate 2-sulfatase
MRVLLVFLFAQSIALAEDRPNILMIAVDDLRLMLGCYGDDRVLTPNIDKLAKRSVLFERAYCQYAKCGTSRLSLMTGLRPDSIGVFSNNERDVRAFRERRRDAKSMARWFKDHGYHSQSFGKIYHDGWDNPDDWSVPSSPGRDREMWEIMDHDNPTGPTIIAERWACPVIQSPNVADDHLFAGRMTNDVVETLQQLPEDAPFFLAVGYRRPHLPFVAPKRYFDLYEPDKSWLTTQPNPPEKSPLYAWFNSDGYGGGAKRVGLTMPNPPSREEAIDWNGYEMRSYLDVAYQGEIPEQRQIDLVHAYAACVSYVDAQIGRLLEAVGDDTTIVLWSDHGWHLGEMCAWGKMTNYEIATRVPLLIAQPGHGGSRTRALAELVDLYPTLCDVAGLDQPSHLEGESLAPILADPSLDGGVALSQYERYNGKMHGRALRTDRYRYVAWFDPSGQVIGRELYDHSKDPDETRNIEGKVDVDLIDELHRQLFTEFGL